ncbi:hypothetical protein L0F63_001110 [Massospora cicadina]|nr:hypothetical protein L0F63_001110 [Massospora cicadina]
MSNFRAKPNSELSKAKRRSCDRCKVRKIRCDGIKGNCVSCAERGLKCSYDRQPKRSIPKIIPSPLFQLKPLYDSIPEFNDLLKYSLTSSYFSHSTQTNSQPWHSFK